MKSRKGEYYIACYNHGEMYLRKKTGYILDDGENQTYLHIEGDKNNE